MKCDLTNKRFGLLIVEKLDCIKSNRSKYWRCKCDCGNTKVIRTAHLNSGVTNSCGCLRKRTKSNHPNWIGVGEISGDYISQVKQKAELRKLKFEITIEYVWQLFLKQNRKCVLSGIELQFQSCGAKRDGTASLDRIDSTKGYLENNVQWVHKAVNEMKMNKTDSELIYYCKKIAQHKNK